MSEKKQLDKIPKFKNEDEEREFWATHSATDYFDMTKAIKVKFPNLKLSTQSISLRLPVSLLEDLKIQANRRDVPYQSFIKMILSDKIKEEVK